MSDTASPRCVCTPAERAAPEGAPWCPAHYLDAPIAADPLTLARALNRAAKHHRLTGTEETEEAERVASDALVAAIRSPHIARPWTMPDGSCVARLRDALAAWCARARQPGRPRLHPPREPSGRGVGRPALAPDERTTGETISPRVSPDAAAIYRSWPAGERGARLSALIEASADRR